MIILTKVGFIFKWRFCI